LVFIWTSGSSAIFSLTASETIFFSTFLATASSFFSAGRSSALSAAATFTDFSASAALTAAAAFFSGGVSVS
jgi:hypothetical protein